MNYLTNVVVFATILVGRFFYEIARGLKSVNKILVMTLATLGLTVSISASTAYTSAGDVSLTEARSICAQHMKIHRIHLERYFEAVTDGKETPPAITFHRLANENLELARPYCAVVAQSYVK